MMPLRERRYDIGSPHRSVISAAITSGHDKPGLYDFSLPQVIIFRESALARFVALASHAYLAKADD